MIDMGTDIVTVEWDEENINKGGNKVQISGAAVITLKFGKATHAKDYIFATDISNKVVTITVLKIFEISLFPAFWSPVLLSAMYLRS